MGGYALKLQSSPHDTVDVDIILRGTIEELVMMVKKKILASPEILNVDTPVGSRSYPLLYIPTPLSIKLGAWMGKTNKHGPHNNVVILQKYPKAVYDKQSWDIGHGFFTC